jgi:hypothetical protein
MKNRIFGAALAALLSTSALAQVNVVPQVGVNSAVITRNTYSSVALALPPAASATDIACIAGSATKTVYVDSIRISGTAGTLVTAPFTLVRRASADTGGTAATTTADWANNIAKNDTTAPTATATLIAYSANPTINDSSPDYITSAELTVPVTSAGTSVAPIVWEWPNTSFSQRPTLRGIAQQFCINLNAVSISSGLLHVAIQWTEE